MYRTMSEEQETADLLVAYPGTLEDDEVIKNARVLYKKMFDMSRQSCCERSDTGRRLLKKEGAGTLKSWRDEQCKVLLRECADHGTLRALTYV